MEHIGVISEGEWSSLSGMYTAEEADFMAQLLHNSSLPNELCGASSLGVPSSTYWPGHELSLNVEGLSESSYYSSNMATSNFYNFSQGSRSSQHGYYLSDSHPILSPNNNSMSKNFCMMDMKNTGSFPIEGDDCLNQEKSGGSAEEYSAGDVSTAVLPDEKDSQVSRETEMPIPESESVPEEKSNPPENSKKRSRSTGDIQKNKKPLKKKQKPNKNEEDSNAGLNGQSTSSYSSDDDCNASQELNGGVSSSLSPKENGSLNSNGKTRASRGSATDPQSLYARKRRERINERLRILQNLVPNGTKVDISTMLEEAVQYVKFVQLQIKLLSSHDLWMYAPLAYNGMDIGLDLKIIPPRQ